MNHLFYLLFAAAASQDSGDPLEAPGVPTSPSASSVQSDRMTLNWSAPTTGGEVASYDAQIRQGGSNIELDNVSAATFSKTFLGLTAETEYTMRVRARNAAGVSAYTTEITETTLAASAPTPPTAPSGLAAVRLTSTSIRVTWTDNSADEDGFRLYRRVDGGSWTALTTTAANVEQYDDTDLDPATEYCYRVVAFIGVSESETSNTDCVELEYPETPTNFAAAPGSDHTRVDLSWDTPVNADSIHVYRDDTQIATLIGSATSYTATGLTEATSYNWKIKATANGKSSAFTSTVAQSTRVQAPSAFTHSLEGGGNPGWFIRFTWTDQSSVNDGYALRREGTLVTSAIGASTEQWDVDGADNYTEGDEWTLRALGAESVPDSVDVSTTMDPLPWA